MRAKRRIENLLEQSIIFGKSAREMGEVELEKNWNVSINTLKMVLFILKQEGESILDEVDKAVFDLYKEAKVGIEVLSAREEPILRYNHEGAMHCLVKLMVKLGELRNDS